MDLHTAIKELVKGKDAFKAAYLEEGTLCFSVMPDGDVPAQLCTMYTEGIERHTAPPGKADVVAIMDVPDPVVNNWVILPLLVSENWQIGHLVFDLKQDRLTYIDMVVRFHTPPGSPCL